ncbi:MAG: SCP2 sterol-binding domain-containing protein [Polyangiales bacterium]
MAYAFPSADWTDAFRDAVNANARYQTAGKDWQHGAVAMIIEADAALGLETPVGMLLEVEHGHCRAARYFSGGLEEDAAAFVIEAPYSQWRAVLQGQLDPILGMMEGKLRLTRGDLPTMIRFVEASRELVKSATQVDTHFVLEAR